MHLWIGHCREEPRERDGSDVDTRSAVTEFAEKRSERPEGKVVRRLKRLVQAAGGGLHDDDVRALPSTEDN